MIKTIVIVSNLWFDQYFLMAQLLIRWRKVCEIVPKVHPKKPAWLKSEDLHTGIFSLSQLKQHFTDDGDPCWGWGVQAPQIEGRSPLMMVLSVCCTSILDLNCNIVAAAALCTWKFKDFGVWLKFCTGSDHFQFTLFGRRKKMGQSCRGHPNGHKAH